MLFRKSKGTHISEHKGHKEMSTNNQMIEFLNPEFVYIPLIDQNTPCDALINVGDHVKVGQPVAQRGGRFSSLLHSSVSGEVISVNKKMWHASGKMVPTIEIKNDFKETLVETIKPNNVNDLTRENIINIVKECGIVGLGGSGFPTYVKYNPSAKVEVVIINAAECEPYITADYTMLSTMLDEVLSGIRYIMKANGAQKAVIAIKRTKKHLIETIQPAIDKEPNIDLFLLDDVYPAGWEKYIVQRVTNKTYNTLPIEAGAVVNNLGTAVAVSKAVENNLPLIEKIVTITGSGIKEPKNVNVKIGTVLSDIIAKAGGYADDLQDAYFIAGGPMTGQSIMFDTLIVNKSLTSVIVLPKQKQSDLLNCMGCGKCNDICPVFLAPIQIKNAYEGKDLKLIDDLQANRCMSCGLCSYVCPSRIELTDAVTRAKLLLMKK